MNNFLDFYKNNRGTILVIIWILAFLLIGFFILGQVSKRISNSTTAISVDNLYKSYTFETTQLNNIEINLISENLIVQPANDNKITVELYGSWNSQIEPNIDCNNSNLIIKQKTKRFFNFLSFVFILVYLLSLLIFTEPLTDFAFSSYNPEPILSFSFFVFES